MKTESQTTILSASSIHDRLQEISDEVKLKKSKSEPFDDLKQEFTEIACQLNGAIIREALMSEQVKSKELHQEAFIANYRLNALINALEKFSNLHRLSAEQALETANSTPDESLVMFYRRANQLHTETATAIDTMVSKCKSMEPAKE